MENENLKIKFSLIIPVYNSENRMELLFSSLYNQNVNDYEVIFINDGSTDDTERYINEKIEDKKNCRCISIQNQGVSHARNIGIENAQGEYICFSDADDYLSEDYFSILDKVLNANDSDVVIFNYNIVYKNELKVGDHFLTDNQVLKNNLLLNFVPFLLREGPETSFMTSVCRLCINKEIIDKYGLRFDETLDKYEDMDFYYQFLDKINSIYLLNDGLYYYVRHRSSTMEKSDDKFYMKNNEIYKKIKMYIQKYGIYEEVSDSLCFFRANQFTQSLSSCFRLEDTDKKEVKKNFFNILNDFKREFISKEYKNLSKNAKFTLLFTNDLSKYLLFCLYFLKEYKRKKRLWRNL
ncbi:hypothetical protein B5F14_09800 [Faecalitalea cylindroides]|uniref:Glycosyltransferase 2-like domain-containing protein n=1 Tax=Faecalitalea cylindroides TaxID=39483 RepID=A0A1Y4LHX5_9FIRM|nr:glycosyltransferase family 2 protein [Faecalitalea cylindroides]OUP56317.1 hypothetical protein B5F14_09800 [Faecalitalea cylindroides]